MSLRFKNKTKERKKTQYDLIVIVLGNIFSFSQKSYTYFCWFKISEKVRNLEFFSPWMWVYHLKVPSPSEHVHILCRAWTFLISWIHESLKKQYCNKALQETLKQNWYWILQHSITYGAMQYTYSCTIGNNGNFWQLWEQAFSFVYWYHNIWILELRSERPFVFNPFWDTKHVHRIAKSNCTYAWSFITQQYRFTERFT